MAGEPIIINNSPAPSGGSSNSGFLGNPVVMVGSLILLVIIIYWAYTQMFPPKGKTNSSSTPKSASSGDATDPLEGTDVTNDAVDNAAANVSSAIGLSWLWNGFSSGVSGLKWISNIFQPPASS